MPLPEDGEVFKTSHDLVDTLQDVFGRHDRVRPSHAKGVFTKGVFTPSEIAKAISIAPHFNQAETATVARFSLFTGIPDLADTDPQGCPHGLAVRFVLEQTPRAVYTDIVSQASPLFPGSTGEEVLGFFQGLRDGSIDDYLASHPSAARFVQEQRRVPKSFAHEMFYSINSFKLIDAEGRCTVLRYRWAPVAGVDYLSDDKLVDKGPNFLFNELPELLNTGVVIFRLLGQVAEAGDVTDDCTFIWSEDRKVVELGTLTLDRLAPELEPPSLEEAIIFDPVPRVAGIEPSADPILAVRSTVYSISGRARRGVEGVTEAQ